jgi:hypothetical protein
MSTNNEGEQVEQAIISTLHRRFFDCFGDGCGVGGRDGDDDDERCRWLALDLARPRPFANRLTFEVIDLARNAKQGELLTNRFEHQITQALRFFIRNVSSALDRLVVDFARFCSLLQSAVSSPSTVEVSASSPPSNPAKKSGVNRKQP